jgi:hypothetical protein
VGDSSADGSRSGPRGRASPVRHFGQSTKETEPRKPSIHAGLRPVAAGQPSWRRGNNGKGAGCSRPRSSGDCRKQRERRRSTVMAISGNCGNRSRRPARLREGIDHLRGPTNADPEGPAIARPLRRTTEATPARVKAPGPSSWTAPPCEAASASEPASHSATTRCR